MYHFLSRRHSRIVMNLFLGSQSWRATELPVKWSKSETLLWVIVTCRHSGETSDRRLGKFWLQYLLWCRACLFSLMIVCYFCQSPDIGRILMSLSCWTLSDLLRQNFLLPSWEGSTVCQLEISECSLLCIVRPKGVWLFDCLLILIKQITLLDLELLVIAADKVKEFFANQ